MSKELKDLEIVAWVGEDELGSGKTGIKQGITASGIIPLAAMDYDEWKLSRTEMKVQMEMQAAAYGKRIRLVRFRFSEVVIETEHGE